MHFISYSCGVENVGQDLPIVYANSEIIKTQPVQDPADSRKNFGFDDHGIRADRIDIALIKFAKAAPSRAVGAPDWLDLIPFEKLREFVSVISNDTGERNGKVIAQRKVGQFVQSARFIAF